MKKIKQIAVDSRPETEGFPAFEIIVALLDDNSLWQRIVIPGIKPAWDRLPDIPQDDEQSDCLETVAQWVLGLGLATGHADTLEQLLDEAGAQIKELMRNSAQDEQGD